MTTIVPNSRPDCGVGREMFFFQAEDGIRDYKVTGVQVCVLSFQAEDGIRDYKVTGVQTCALPIQAEDGIRDYKVTGVQTCALPIRICRTEPILKTTKISKLICCSCGV